MISAALITRVTGTIGLAPLSCASSPITVLRQSFLSQLITFLVYYFVSYPQICPFLVFSAFGSGFLLALCCDTPLTSWACAFFAYDDAGIA